MATTYHQLLLDLAVALNATEASVIADAEASYAVAATVRVSVRPEWPDVYLREVLLSAEQYWLSVIGETPRHPARRPFLVQTASVANGDALPSTNSAGTAPLIGLPDSVEDASDTLPCEDVGLAKMRSYLRFAATLYDDSDFYWYALDGSILLTTRAAVKLMMFAAARGVWWSNPPTNTIAANMQLPDYFRAPIVDKAIMLAAGVEGEFMTVVQDAAARVRDFEAQQRAYANPKNLRHREAPTS